MMIIGCDFHPSWQQIAWLGTATGETGEQKLGHAAGDAGQAIFAGFNEKHQRLIVEVSVGIPVSGARKIGYSTRVFPGDDTTENDVIGDRSIAEEYASGKTDRSQGWHNAVKLQSKGLGLDGRLTLQAETIVELTAKHDPSFVGGPIDVVLVTRNRGITWVRRKPECEAQDYPRKAVSPLQR